MEEIGAALAPIAKQIISFVSIEVMPFFQSMIDGFQQLSPGMQELVVVGTAAVPVVAAVALGLAGMGAAFTALAGVGEVVGVLAAIGVAVAGIHFSGMDTAALNLYHAIADNFPNIPEMFSNISAAVDAVSGKFNDWLQKSTGQAPLLAAHLRRRSGYPRSHRSQYFQDVFGRLDFGSAEPIDHAQNHHGRVGGHHPISRGQLFVHGGSGRNRPGKRSTRPTTCLTTTWPRRLVPSRVPASSSVRSRKPTKR